MGKRAGRKRGNKKIKEKDREGKIKENEREREMEMKEKDIWEKLLNKTGVIRDPVHGDVEITDLERKLINSAEFQRLSRIKQLGGAYKVYSGATHSRLSHSLGVLYMTQQIIQENQRNQSV